MEPHLKLFNPVFHNVSGILKKNVLEEARKAFSDEINVGTLKGFL